MFRHVERTRLEVHVDSMTIMNGMNLLIELIPLGLTSSWTLHFEARSYVALLG
jgi:hypothetical protein